MRTFVILVYAIACGWAIVWVRDAAALCLVVRSEMVLDLLQVHLSKAEIVRDVVILVLVAKILMLLISSRKCTRFLSRRFPKGWGCLRAWRDVFDYGLLFADVACSGVCAVWVLILCAR